MDLVLECIEKRLICQTLLYCAFEKDLPKAIPASQVKLWGRSDVSSKKALLGLSVLIHLDSEVGVGQLGGHPAPRGSFDVSDLN